MSAGYNALAGPLDGCLASTGEAKLSLNALDTVGRVDVLDEGELPASGTTLARCNGGSGQEVFPDLDELLITGVFEKGKPLHSP